MSHPNPSTALARVLVDELVRSGLRHAVVAPGSRSTALVYAFEEHPRVAVHVEIDERSAGFLAIGLARGGGGRAAAVVTTSGTATANLFPAVMEADAAGVALLVLTADRPGELRHTGANQVVDQIKLYGDRVRWFCEVGVAEDRADANAYWRSTACRGWAAAHGSGGGSGRAGPVHLNLAFREPTVPVSDDGRTADRATTQDFDGRPDGRPWVDLTPGPRQLRPHDLRVWARRLADTPRGIIVLGERHVNSATVAELAAVTGYPVVAELVSSARGTDAIAHGHLLAGSPFAAAHRPDLVVRIGRTGLSRPLERWLDATIPQVLVDGGGAWLDPGRTVSDLVAADPSHWCHAVAALMGAAERGRQSNRDEAWRRAWVDAEAAVRAVVASHLDDAKPSGPAAARAALAAAPAGANVVVASSAVVRDMDAYGPPRDDVWIVANRGASGIDGFVSTALGVALASEAPTVAVSGDLSFLHDQSGLLLAPATDVTLAMVVIDNDGGGLFHQLPQAQHPHFERLFGTPHGIDLRDLAHAHDLAATTITQLDDLRTAVPTALEATGVHLLVVPTDRAADVDVRAQIQQAVTESFTPTSGHQP